MVVLRAFSLIQACGISFAAQCRPTSVFIKFSYQGHFNLCPWLSDRWVGMQTDELSPAVFAPVVRQFALAWPMAVRHLAAQALVPLVTPTQLAPVLKDILQNIPCSPPVLSHNEVSALQEHHWIINQSKLNNL